jgi:hypothetical protein
MLPPFLVKAETTENLSVGEACFAPYSGREPRRIQKTRILNEHHSAPGRLSIWGPGTMRLASWIVVVDFGRIGFNWQAQP